METVQRERILMWLAIGLEVEVSSDRQLWLPLPKAYYPSWINALKQRRTSKIKFRLRDAR